jgi:hypothetical protein
VDLREKLLICLAFPADQSDESSCANRAQKRKRAKENVNMTNADTDTAPNVAEQGAHVAPDKASSKKRASQKKGAPKGQKAAKASKDKAAAKKESKAGRPATAGGIGSRARPQTAHLFLRTDRGNAGHRAGTRESADSRYPLPD